MEISSSRLQSLGNPPTPPNLHPVHPLHGYSANSPFMPLLTQFKQYSEQQSLAHVMNKSYPISDGLVQTKQKVPWHTLDQTPDPPAFIALHKPPTSPLLGSKPDPTASYQPDAQTGSHVRSLFSKLQTRRALDPPSANTCVPGIFSRSTFSSRHARGAD